MQPYSYADGNPVSLTDPTGGSINSYCVQVGRFYRLCASDYDHWSSVQYILWLKARSGFYSRLAFALQGTHSAWAQSLAHYYRVISIVYAQAAYKAELILDACGGMRDPHSGFYVTNGQVRGGYWWWGWHYTRWYTITTSIWFCHD